MSLFSPLSFPLQHRISRSALTLLAIAALATNAPAFADEKPQAKPKAAKPDSIQIIPAAKAPAPKKSTAKNSTAKPTEDAARVEAARVEAALVSSAAYRRIYRSIPFSRSLHDVNPGYRHDATMELLTGKSRRFSSGSNGQTSTDPTR
ncbi:MAG: hypothetical protein ACKO3T_11445 [Planctomycetaceae bacterium]